MQQNDSRLGPSTSSRNSNRIHILLTSRTKQLQVQALLLKGPSSVAQGMEANKQHMCSLLCCPVTPCSCYGAIPAAAVVAVGLGDKLRGFQDIKDFVESLEKPR